jgi:hypothetical protein
MAAVIWASVVRVARSAPIHLLEALRDVLLDPVPLERARSAIDWLELLAEDPQHRVEIAYIPSANGPPGLGFPGGDLGQSRRSLCGRRRRLDRCALLPPPASSRSQRRPPR